MNVYIDYNCIDDGSSFRSSHMLFHIFHKDGTSFMNSTYFIFLFLYSKKNYVLENLTVYAQKVRVHISFSLLLKFRLWQCGDSFKY